MADSVSSLAQMNEDVKKACVLNVVNNTRTLPRDFVPYSKDVLGFRINQEKQFCKYFGISEIHFIDHVRSLQLDRLRTWRARI